MKNNILKKSLSVILAASVLSSAAYAGAATTPGKADYYDTDSNWARVLQHTLYFYDANMCGTGVNENNLLSWRGNCHTYDAEVPLDSKHTNLSDSFIKKYKDI